VAPTATRRLLEHVASTLPDAPVDDARLAALSDRERAILLEVAAGGRTPRSRPSCTSPRPTVKTHLGRLRAKLDVHDRVQLVILAYDTGWWRPAR
jgi:DNA-binding CsgD family transcriptional regulator